MSTEEKPLNVILRQLDQLINALKAFQAELRNTIRGGGQ